MVNNNVRAKLNITGKISTLDSAVVKAHKSFSASPSFFNVSLQEHNVIKLTVMKQRQ